MNPARPPSEPGTGDDILSVDLPSPAEIVSPEERRAWRRPSTLGAVAALGGIWLQIILAVALFALFPNAVTFLIAFFLIGGAQHGLSMAAHEFVHYLVVPNDRALNDALGNWLFAAPVALPFKLYRHRHFSHHRWVGTDKDTKTVYRANLRGWRLFYEIGSSLSGLDYVRQVLRTLRRESHDRAEVQRESYISWPPLLVAQLALFVSLTAIRPWLYFGLWLAPLMTAAILFGKLRSSVEHQPDEGASAPIPVLTGTLEGLPLTRSVQATWFERLFLSKLNFHHHAEHHIWPQISYQYLPIIHRRLVEARAFEDPRIAAGRSYLAVLKRLSFPA